MVLFISKLKGNYEIRTSGDECLTSFFYVMDHSFTAVSISAASDGTIIALDSDGIVYYASNTGANEHDYNWLPLPLQKEPQFPFKQISVGSYGQIWAINGWKVSYKYDWASKQWYNGEIWEQISAATDGSILFARNNINKLYYSSSSADPISWTSFDNSHNWEYIDAGSIDSIWALNSGITGGRAYKLSGLDTTTNIYYGCSPNECFYQLSVGSDGTAIGIDDNDKLYYFTAIAGGK
eukprot:225305_1